MSNETSPIAEETILTESAAATTQSKGRVPGWLISDVLLPFLTTRAILWMIGLLAINLVGEGLNDALNPRLRDR